ncbi:MAG: DNA adenine methylase [Endomicrobium sp.]|jgi:adenine-specific DNA methylase|nr:DNA adenine methylase [Endomicrobium sp.]
MGNMVATVQSSFLPYIENSGISVFDENNPFPSTRYQGSKNKLTCWIWDNIKDLDFETALDAFGGTGSVSHLLKRKGKQVFYNDILEFNYIIGKALIENDSTKLSDEDIDLLLSENKNKQNFIQKTFKGIYYTDEENAWLDNIICNINCLNDEYKKAIAFFALFQSCIIKRPYNLFHRANLYIRLADVKRSFGNKITWDKSFENYFRHFVKEANNAIFYNGSKCRSYNRDALDLDINDIDLVYLDTPYISNKGVGTNYLDFYHFLEGLADYENWENKICDKYKHIPIKSDKKCSWTDKNQITSEFEKVIKKFLNSKIVISYRNDGIPSVQELCDIVNNYKNKVSVIYSRDYKYALSNDVKEVLIIGY